MPNNKRNISFKKKNKRGGRGGSSIGVKVIQIPEISNEKVYEASSSSSKDNSSYYRLGNRDNIVHNISKEQVNKLVEEERAAAIKIQRAERKRKKRKAAKKIQRAARRKRQRRREAAAKKIQSAERRRRTLAELKNSLRIRKEADATKMQEENLKKAADTFYTEVYKNITSLTSSQHTAINDLIEFFGIDKELTNEDIDNAKKRLERYKERIIKRYIEKTNEEGILRINGTGYREEIDNALKKAAKILQGPNEENKHNMSATETQSVNTHTETNNTASTSSTAPLTNNNSISGDNSQQISDKEEVELKKYLIDQNQELLYNYLIEPDFLHVHKTTLIQFLKQKIAIDGRITLALINNEGGLYILAKKLLTKGEKGKEILKKYYPENYNPYNESQLGGSRKPTKKQKRKGKLPKHLRNTRRRKSYHKKRQLKTKNSRTRKFKK